MTVQTALHQGTKLLEEASVAAPRLTAEVLLAFALGRERVYLYSHPEVELAEVSWLHYGRYLWQRIEGRPTQYITHRQEFYGREFRVTPAVLIPRPETELLVEASLHFWRDGIHAIDVGCGSGAIAVSLSLETGSPVTAADISGAALEVARENGSSLGARVAYVQADLLEAFAPASFDMIVSNPPYVANSEREGLQREVRDFEPAVALFGGDSGHEVYSRIVGQAHRVLRPGGLLLFELGFRSISPVWEMLDGWADRRDFDDLNGIPRVLAARRPDAT